MKYYELLVPEEGWVLEIAESDELGGEVELWRYSECKRVNDTTVAVDILKPGIAIDYNQTTYDAMIVSDKMKHVLLEIASNDIQVIEARVPNQESNWFVVNVLSIVDCIDFEKSGIQYSSDSESGRKINGITSLKIDAQKVTGQHVFRVRHWEVLTIISEKILDACKSAGVKGLVCLPVSD